MLKTKHLFLILCITLIPILSYSVLNAQEQIENESTEKKPIIKNAFLSAPSPDGLLQIDGENFSNDDSEVIVTLNGIKLALDHVSKNNIHAKIKETSHSGDLIVIINKIVSKPFNIKLPTPIIHYLEFPESISKEKKIILHGEHFSNRLNNLKLYFGKQELVIDEISEEKIESHLPEETINDSIYINKEEFISNKIKTNLLVHPIIKKVYFQNTTIGSKVTIEGENFHKETEKNIIKFNDIKAVIVYLHPDGKKIEVVIPENAQSGYLTIEVNKIISNPFPYNLSTGPTISIGPIEENPNTNETLLTIYSSSFSNSGKKYEIFLDKKSLPIQNAFLNKLKVLLPTKLPSKGIIYAKADSLKGNEIEIDFQSQLAPRITKIETDVSFSQGHKVIVTGSNFDLNMKDTSIKWLNIESVSKIDIQGTIQDEVKDGTYIKFSASKYGLKSNQIKVKIGDGRDIVRRTPEIHEIEFPQGHHPGSEIIIRGTGFSNKDYETKITLNDNPLPITGLSYGSISSTIPKSAKSGYLKIISYDNYQSNRFPITIIDKELNEEKIEFKSTEEIQKLTNKNQILGQINFTNQNKNIIIENLLLNITCEKNEDILALKNFHLSLGKSILTEIKTPEKKANGHNLSFKNIDIPVSEQEQIIYIKSKILPFISDQGKCSISLDQKNNFKSKYKYDDEAKPLIDLKNPLIANTIIHNPNTYCLSSKDHNYCEIEENTKENQDTEEISEEENNPDDNSSEDEETISENKDNTNSETHEDTNEAEANIEIISFIDIKNSDWFKKAVSYLKTKQIISGYPDNSFKPQLNITRAEFLKITLLGANLDIEKNKEKNNNFKDTSKHWAKNYINAAANQNIINGETNFFNPNKYITRAEATKIILETFEVDMTKRSNFNFADTKEHWCKDYCKQAKLNNIIEGYEKGGAYYFYPNNLLNRAEAAQIIYNVMTTKE